MTPQMAIIIINLVIYAFLNLSFFQCLYMFGHTCRKGKRRQLTDLVRGSKWKHESVTEKSLLQQQLSPSSRSQNQLEKLKNNNKNNKTSRVNNSSTIKGTWVRIHLLPFYQTLLDRKKSNWTIKNDNAKRSGSAW